MTNDVSTLPNAGPRSTVADRFTEAEAAEFARDGFAIVRQMVSTDLRQRMITATRAGLVGPIDPVEYEADVHYPGSPASRQAEGGETIRRLKDAQSRDPAFAEWVRSPGLVGRLQQLFGERVVMPLAHHNCIMTKQPRFSSETHWHQDLRYWAYERPELVSVWIALGAERAGNGCLEVIAGTHRGEFGRERLDAALFLREDLPENQALIARKQLVELDPGDVLFFHARTFHAAGRNTTDNVKFSVVFTFRPESNRPVPGTRSAELPELLLPWVSDGSRSA